MLVRKRNEINRQYENESHVETEQQENPTNGIPLEALKETVEKDEDKELPVQIKAGATTSANKAEDEELEKLLSRASTYGLQQYVRTGTQREITKTCTAKRNSGECE